MSCATRGVRRAAIMVLSAGRSPFLREVLESAAAAKGPTDELIVVWSGANPIPEHVVCEWVIRIPPAQFDHGCTRLDAVKAVRAEFVAFLSDDATPSDSSWLERLLAPFSDTQVAAVFGRQCARPRAPQIDRVFREARYPPTSAPVVLYADQLSPVAPVSNANAAYRRGPLLEVGGFPCPCSFAEDRQATTQLLRRGWAVHYAADATVLHTHYHGWRDILRRGRAAAPGGWASRGSLKDVLRFAGRAVWGTWNVGGVRAVVAVGAAIVLRLLGAMTARRRL